LRRELWSFDPTEKRGSCHDYSFLEKKFLFDSYLTPYPEAVRLIETVDNIEISMLGSNY